MQHNANCPKCSIGRFAVTAHLKVQSVKLNKFTTQSKRPLARCHHVMLSKDKLQVDRQPRQPALWEANLSLSSAHPIREGFLILFPKEFYTLDLLQCSPIGITDCN